MIGGAYNDVYGYGLLYNWYAVNTGKLAPLGWHIPTDTELTTLTTFLGGMSVAGGKMKKTLLTHWLTPNTGATNSSGFTALPGGCRDYDGNFYYLSYYAYFWSSTEFSSTYPWYRSLFYDFEYVFRSYYFKTNGFSCRCLLNNPSAWYEGMMVKDADGHYYPTVKIGTQVWMKSNLKTTKYNDGTDIPNVTDTAAWAALTTPAYCSYNNAAIVEYTTRNGNRPITSNFVFPVITEDKGSLAHYNFQRIGNTLVDLGTGGANGTITDCLQRKEGLDFNRTTSYVSATGNGLTGDISIMGRFYARSYGEGNFGRIFENSKLKAGLDPSSSGRLVFSRDSSVIEVYAGGSSVLLNRWYNFCITSTSAGVTNFYIEGVLSGTANQAAGTPSAGTSWYIGNRAANDRTFDGIIQDLVIKQRIITLEEIKAYNNQWASRPLLLERFQDVPCDGSVIVPTDWTRGTGSYKGIETTIFGQPAKALQCTVAGTIARQSTQAWGTFKKVFYKSADANVQDWIFIGATKDNAAGAAQNGYMVRFGSDEKFYLYRISVGVLTAVITSASTYSLSTFYEIEVRRTRSGAFTMYILGGAVTSQTSLGTGTDATHTTSNFNVLDDDAGDRSSMISIKDGIIQ